MCASHRVCAPRHCACASRICAWRKHASRRSAICVRHRRAGIASRRIARRWRRRNLWYHRRSRRVRKFGESGISPGSFSRLLLLRMWTGRSVSYAWRGTVGYRAIARSSPAHRGAHRHQDIARRKRRAAFVRASASNGIVLSFRHLNHRHRRVSLNTRQRTVLSRQPRCCAAYRGAAVRSYRARGTLAVPLLQAFAQRLSAKKARKTH